MRQRGGDAIKHAVDTTASPAEPGDLPLMLDMPHVRIHDLRHTFASLIANLGTTNIFTLKDLLHHASVVTTERYAHLFDKMPRDASEGSVAGLRGLGIEY